jgi:predicted RNA binding protein YcfA (HicA-like mRNA interferase family)
MPKLPNISGKELFNILCKIGFIVKRQNSSHINLKHPDGRSTTIPLHNNKDLAKGTLKAILRDAGISNEELRKLL